MSIKVGDQIRVLRDQLSYGPRAGDICQVGCVDSNGKIFYLRNGWAFNVRDLGIDFELYQPPGQLAVPSNPSPVTVKWTPPPGPSPFTSAHVSQGLAGAQQVINQINQQIMYRLAEPPVTLPTLEEAHVCDMKRYEGLTERYDFCAACDRKQEIT